MLSLVDIQNKEFKKSVLGGYNIDEVNEFLDEILQSYQDLINENYTLKDRVSVLDTSLEHYRQMEDTIQNVLLLAEKTAQETKTAAHEKAEEIKKDAEARVEKIIVTAEERALRIVEEKRQEAFEVGKKVDEMRRQYMAYKGQFKQLLQNQSSLLEQADLQVTMQGDSIDETVADIERDNKSAAEPFKPIDNRDEKAFHTKEYIPVSEIEALA